MALSRSRLLLSGFASLAMIASLPHCGTAKPEGEESAEAAVSEGDTVADAATPEQEGVEDPSHSEVPVPSTDPKAEPPADDQGSGESDMGQNETPAEAPQGMAWQPSDWEVRRFLTREGTSPQDILSGETVFAKPGDDFSGSMNEIKNSNSHLRGASKIVAGDHFRTTGGMERHSAGEGSYTVQRGDTLQKIAWKIYGSKERWVELYFMNPSIEHWDRITPGMNLSYVDTSAVASFDPPARQERMETAKAQVEPVKEASTPPPAQVAEARPAQPVAQPVSQPVAAPVQTPPPQQVQQQAEPALPPGHPPVPGMNQSQPQQDSQWSEQMDRGSKRSRGLNMIKWIVLLAVLSVSGWFGWTWLQGRKKKRVLMSSLTDEYQTYSEVAGRLRTPTGVGATSVAPASSPAVSVLDDDMDDIPPMPPAASNENQ